MKLIILHGKYGDLTLTETDVVQSGPFAGLTQRQMFERIMTEGYGGGVPSVFHTVFKNGEIEQFKGSDAAPLIGRPDVEECWVIAPICGG